MTTRFVVAGLAIGVALGLAITGNDVAPALEKQSQATSEEPLPVSNDITSVTSADPYEELRAEQARYLRDLYEQNPPVGVQVMLDRIMNGGQNGDLGVTGQPEFEAYPLPSHNSSIPRYTSSLPSYERREFGAGMARDSSESASRRLTEMLRAGSPSTRSVGAINPYTGEFYPRAGDGYVSSRDGRYFAPAGPNAVVDTRTGQVVPVGP